MQTKLFQVISAFLFCFQKNCSIALENLREADSYVSHHPTSENQYKRVGSVQSNSHAKNLLIVL